jgi:hypothetical protein
MRIELEPIDLEDVAADLSRWRPEEVIELIKKIDQHMSDWTLIMDLKPWIDEQAKVYAQEEADERREQGKCYVDPGSGQQVHQTPHVGCILR